LGVKFRSAAREIIVKFAPVIIAASVVLGWLHHDIWGSVVGAAISILVAIVTYWIFLLIRSSGHDNGKND